MSGNMIVKHDPEEDEVEVGSTLLFDDALEPEASFVMDPPELRTGLEKVTRSETNQIHESLEIGQVHVKIKEESDDDSIISEVDVKPVIGSSPSNQKGLPSGPYKSIEEFQKEMHESIDDVVKECITFLKMDPRGYHPFYLRVFKYITLGQRHGYFDPAEATIVSIWLKYDNYAKELFERSKTEKIQFSREKSPYLTYILTGKVIRNGVNVRKPPRDEEEMRKVLKDIEAKAKRLVHERSVRGGKSLDIRNDISIRRDLFNLAKTIASPWDCASMNKIWAKFVCGFENDVRKKKKGDLGKLQATGKSNSKSETGSISRKCQEIILKEYQVKWVGKHAQLQRRKAVATQRKATLVRKRLTKTIGKLSAHSTSQVQVPKKLSRARKPVKPASSDTAPLTHEHPTSGDQQEEVDDNPVKSENASSNPVTANQSKSVTRKTRTRKSSKTIKVESDSIKESKLSPLKDNSEDQHQHCSSPPTVAVPQVVKEAPSNLKATSSRKTVKRRRQSAAAEDVPTKRSRKARPWPNVCEECGITFRRKDEMVKHLQFGHGTPSFPCAYCSSVYQIERSLWRHMECAHFDVLSGKPNLDLPEPPQQGVTLRSAGSKEESTLCPTCGKDFFEVTFLRRHINQVHGEGSKLENSLVCPECGKSYKNKDSLGQHITQVHRGEDYRCDVCRRVCQTPGKLWKHKTEVHGMTDLPPPPNVVIQECHYCGEKLLRGLSRHVEKEHPDRLKEFRALKRARKRRPPSPKNCPVCGNMISGYGFRTHVRKHETGVWLPQASNTKFKFQPGRFLDKFKDFLFRKGLVKLSDHENYYDRVIICNSCKFEAKTITAVKVHFGSAHPEVCAEVLGNQEVTESSPSPSVSGPIPIPAVSKNPEKRLRCDHCSQSNLTEGELRTHLETLHPESCWKCPQCSMVILTPEEMSKHFETGCDTNVSNQVVKTKEQPEIARNNSIPFQTFYFTAAETTCKRCSFVASTIEELQTHVKEIHPTEYFPCKFCPRPFHTARGLHMHLHTSHKNCNKAAPGVLAERAATRKTVVPYASMLISCQLCAQKITLDRYERYHLKNIHGVVEEGLFFRCQFCPNVYKRRHAFLTHVEEHHGHLLEMTEIINSVKKIQGDVPGPKIKKTRPLSTKNSKEKKSTKVNSKSSSNSWKSKAKRGKRKSKSEVRKS